MKRFTFLTLLILTISCSSNDDQQSSGDNTQVNNPKLLTIEYPSRVDNSMAQIHENATFTYENEKISKIKEGANTYSVNYINNDLIELHLLEHPYSFDLENKTSIHLHNNIVLYIVSNTTTTYSPSEITNRKDSIAYTYSNNYISKTEHYEKATNKSSYSSPIKTEYTISNGNIVTAKIIGGYTTIITQFTYDNTPNIKYGAFAIDHPLNNGLPYYLIHDQIGTQNANNLTSMTKTIEGGMSTSYNKTISYTRKTDSNNRLQEISMTGTSQILNSPTTYLTGTFSDEKIIFKYQ